MKITNRATEMIAEMIDMFAYHYSCTSLFAHITGVMLYQ